ncbi:glycosyltransferase family 4 protein [Erythrobacter sp. YJ-T3-07]|uniref:glycosyltransferase family 4 protein n=1 Tax=Erythrobacter sp. YJ-T3-07 TaxID=2793063 RepID=UPI001F40ED5E|nr:glycosyltransferase family 4 protein [Erythrobacter sp. YJ-T3-07]
MRIFMLCDFFNEELEYQENHLVDYYRRHGHEVIVVCSLYENVFDYYTDKKVDGPARDYEVNGARIVKLPYRYNILNRLRAYPKIDGLLEEFAPDLIFVHDIMLNLPECIAYVKRHPQTRMIMDYHADYANSGKNWLSLKVLHGVIRKRFLDRARPHLSMIYPIVPAGIDFLNEVYRVPREEMTLLPLGTDLEYGAKIAASGAGAAIRQELAIPEDHFVVFTGGKLTPSKRTETLIEAVNTLNREDLHVLVAGAAGPNEAEYFAGLEQLAKGNPRIHFRGWQDKEGVYRHLDAADIAVFPASQSILWQQSIGMGLPVIVGDRSEFMPPSDATYLNRHDNLIVLDHEEETAPQIAQLLRGLTEDRERLAQMAEGARRTADEMLDWNKLIEETLRHNRVTGVE